MPVASPESPVDRPGAWTTPMRGWGEVPKDCEAGAEVGAWILWMGFPAVLSVAVCLSVKFAAILLVLLLAIREVAVRKERSEAALMRIPRPESEFEPSWWVELAIHQGHCVTGRDRGLMWSEDGRVFFLGSSTSFAIRAHQVLDRVRYVDRSGPRLVLPLDSVTTIGPVSLSFWPLDMGISCEDSAASMRYAFNTVLFRPGDGPAGQWPPLTLGPGAMTVRGATWAFTRRCLRLFSFSTVLLFWVGMWDVTLGFAVFVAAGWTAFAAEREALGQDWAARLDAQKAWATR